MSATKITIQAIVSAEKTKVWDYYTNPEHITKWNFASDEWHCPSASNDMRVAGRYSSRMEAKDGSWGFDFEAVYDEVVDGERFSYTMSDGRQASVAFKNLGEQTEMIVSFDAETQNSVELQRDGWQAILNNFKKYTETN